MTTSIPLQTKEIIYFTNGFVNHFVQKERSERSRFHFFANHEKKRVDFVKFVCYTTKLYGGLAERSKAAVLKTVVPARVPGVRIPKPPPNKNTTKSCGVFCFVLETAFYHSAINIECNACDIVRWNARKKNGGVGDFFWFCISSHWNV